MQAANTNAMLGLLCHNLGGRGDPELYAEAVSRYRQALDYYQATSMRDMAWKLRFYLAHTAFRQGILAITADEQRAAWLESARWLEEAAADIEFVRSRFVETNTVAREHTRLGLISDKEKIYVFAVQLHYY
jgi:hypothetical protein